MALRINKNVVVAAILGLCILAIPVALISKGSAHKSGLDTDDTNTSFVLGTDHIQVYRLNGMIADDDEDSFLSSLSNDDAPGTIKKFRKAIKDVHIKGILLRVNSPGGTVSASQELTDEIIAFKKTGRPVVVSMGDLAASGGYYVSSACDKIIAEPGTLTGSIGVIMNMMNFKGLADKVGVQPEIIKSGKFKDIANPLRPMTADEHALLQALIMDSYDMFVQAVAQGRNMKVEDVKKLADGRVYSGRQALKAGLVDRLGGYDEALDELQKICMTKFDLKEKLPVKDNSSGGIFSALVESASSLTPLSARRPRQSSLLGDLLPPSMDSKYAKVPMWVMQ